MTDTRGFEDDEAARRLREVLAAEGRAIQPSGAGLARIQARIEAGRRSRRGWLRSLAIGAAAGATAAIVIVVVLLVPSGNQGGAPVTVSPSPTTSTSSPPSPSPTPSAAPTHAPHDVAIYYVGKTADPRQLLYREVVSRPWPAGNAVVGDAIQAMLTTAPRDPDYTSYWPAGVTVKGVSLNATGTAAIVDLSVEAETPSPSAAAAAEISARQLYYTVQGASPKIDSVELRIDGKKVDALWGTPIENPMTDPDQYTIGQYFAHVWITSPDNGATVPQTVEIKGEAIAYEATVGWQVLENGTVVKHGSTMASIGAPEQGSWQVSVTLPPGNYVIRAYETSGKDGSPLYVDTKNITVQ
jgi:spore germination protein GerM